MRVREQIRYNNKSFEDNRRLFLSSLTQLKRTNRRGNMPCMLIEEDIDLWLAYNSLSFNLSLITCLQLWLSIYCAALRLPPRTVLLNETEKKNLLPSNILCNITTV